MRDIKFRQWRPESKSWHYFEFTDGMCSGVINATLSVYPIMQFTGLYDKNGKEIYEGDILRDGNDLYNYVVIFDEYNGMFKRRKISEYPIEKTLARNYEYKDGNATINLKFTFEIIGNIYENPELIKIPADNK